MSLESSSDYEDDIFLTPQNSRHVLKNIGVTNSFASSASLYTSASDLPNLDYASKFKRTMSGVLRAAGENAERNDDVQLISHNNHPTIDSEDQHELTSHLNGPPYSFTFKDGIRSVDFVLVWANTEMPEVSPNMSPSQRQKQMKQKELFNQHLGRRTMFQENLQREGLELEPDHVAEIPLRFMKIHAPKEVCCRYAEILKLRMPMREKLDECFLKKRFVLHFPGLPVLEITTPAVLQDMGDFISRMFNFVKINQYQFPPLDRHFTAVYSRDKEYLFDIKPDFFGPANKARIIDFILRRKKFCQESDSDDFAFGIERLISDGTYAAAYAMHEGDKDSGTNKRAKLYKHWASIRNFYKYQPLDHVREYFGVKISLYFAWLGFYTYMLIPASIVGLICFIYAVITLENHQPSKDICENTSDIYMCPLCDKLCDYWKLDSTCIHAKISYLVDNPATVFFAVFMSFWAALFLELWKRYSSEISHRWDLTGFDIQEEHPRPEYLARLAHIKKKTVNIVTKTIEPKPPFWTMRVPGVLISASTVLLLVFMAFVAVFAVILYRMSMMAALSIHGDIIDNSYAVIFTSATAAFINLVCIMIFNLVYARMAEYLTEKELQRTQTEFDESLTLKIYLLQFINFYTSIFYIAFIKGKLVGRPNKYNRFFGYRQEECSPGGCLLELSVQLAMIMIGKQAMNTVFEMILPKVWQWIKMLTVLKTKRDRAEDSWPQWAKDFKLNDFDPRGLFPEYLEMVLQYGFVTIFVASFPLAPLFAFLNNALEIRLDAKKLLTHYRRPVPQRVKDIGVWFRILDSIGKFAVITNAFIIAFTSNFIPELVYKHVVSENDNLNGFLNYSLAVFDVKDYPEQYRPESHLNLTITTCRYPDYRNPPGDLQYKYAPIFWHILAARLAFVAVFENVVAIVILLVKWLVPDTPTALKEQIRREAYMTNELIMEQELQMARGGLTSNDSEMRLRRQTSGGGMPRRPFSDGDVIREEDENGGTNKTMV